MEMRMRKRWAGLMWMVVVLLLGMHAGHLVSAANSTECRSYRALWSQPQIEAMNNLYANWSGTPNPEVNLKGWGPINMSMTSDEYYYWWLTACNRFAFGWKGLECFQFDQDVPGYMYNCTGTETATTYRITGLTLNNASITGPLPAAIGDLYPLTDLVLTGNPGLQGSIPEAIGNLSQSLKTLDLHTNNLGGRVPGVIFNGSFFFLLNLDLSGNSLTGNIPQLDHPRQYLRTFSVARNQLTGNLDDIYFSEWWQLELVDLSNNKFSRHVPFLNLSNSPILKYINMSGNQFRANLSMDSIGIFTTNASSSSLQVLDLSNNLIHGDVSNLTVLIEGHGLELQELYLDGNNIFGTLFMNIVLQKIVMKKLGFKTLSLMGNKIRGVRYNKTNTVNELLYIRLGDNPFCNNTGDICGADAYAARCFCYRNCKELSVCNQAHYGMRKGTILKIALSISVPFVLVLLVGAILLYRSRRQHQYLLLQVKQICEEHGVKPTIFTYSELYDFHPDMKLGQGGYGAVYKGVLPNANVVTVKRLHINSQQGVAEFLNEVALISGIKHRNLVKLKGCCICEKQRLLVYEYVDNHDLDWNLLEGKSIQILSWLERLSICLGVAHGLHCLHALAQPKIIHRDIKAANILLDSNLQPKIADFGLALLFPEETSHIVTVHVAGTKDYLALEYAILGQLSEKADVYSFGVVCLEIVSGRRNIDNKMAPEEVVLTNWIQMLYKEGNIMDIIDSRLESLNENELLEVRRVIYIAMLCLQYSQDVRSSMAGVVSMLQGDLMSVVADLESAQVLQNYFGGHPTSFEISQLSMETINESESLCLNRKPSSSSLA